MGEKDDIHVITKDIGDSSTLAPTPAIEQLEAFSQYHAKPPTLWMRTRENYAEFLSEFFGTFIFLLFSFGVMAQVVLSKAQVGDYTLLSLGWAVGIMLGAYTASRSGGHLNPAVTLTLCLLRSFPWRKFPTYVIAQILGAFCASAVVYGNYASAIEMFEGGDTRTVPGFSNHSTAGIFATYPAKFVGTSSAFFSEFLASAILMFCIFILQFHKTGTSNHIPPCLAMVFLGISACFGWETGFAINFARDFGPRCFLSLMGYGKDVWTASHYYFWIPMIAPFLGCVSGGFLFDLFLNDADNTPVNKPYFGLGRFRKGRSSSESDLV